MSQFWFVACSIFIQNKSLAIGRLLDSEIVFPGLEHHRDVFVCRGGVTKRNDVSEAASRALNGYHTNATSYDGTMGRAITVLESLALDHPQRIFGD